MKAEIRRVHPGDERDLAYIQTESWKAGFCHILDPDTLERCTDIARAESMYRGLLSENKGNGYLLTLAGKPHCMAWWDKARDADFAGSAELICIHSLPDNWHKGYGSMMMNAVLSDIREAGYHKVVLWVFSENDRARAFYEACGFSCTEHVKEILGKDEVCYSRAL